MHVDNQSNVLNRTYTYSSTQNDGRIETMVDAVSGETVQYQYDSLKRLISAETTGAQWGQSFSYDGFGNLLAQTVTKGSAPSLSVLVSGTTNRITSSGYTYDSNGNLTAAPGLTMSYDVENRTVSATRSGSGTEYYAYGPSNERVWKREEFTGGGSANFVYFYGVDGALLTTNSIDDDWDYNVYFAGRTVWRKRVSGNSTMPPGAVSPDRLGSTVKHFPYGDEPTTTAPNREKFATYYRDEVTALDYARNRYYSSTIARFTTADPYGGSARPGAPQTWNRYSYVGGDPVNRNDPSGLEDIYDLPWFPNWGLIYALAPNTNFFWVTGTAPMPNSPHASAFWGAFGPYTGGPADLQVEPDGPSSMEDPYYWDSLLASYRERAIALAMSKLVPGSPCWDLFNVGGGGLAPDALLAKLAGGDTDFGRIVTMYLANYQRAAQTLPVLNAPDAESITYVTIALNSNLAGLWISHTEAERALTILHELAHAYQYIYGFGSTGIYNENEMEDNPSAQAAISGFNTALVKEKCQ